MRPSHATSRRLRTSATVVALLTLPLAPGAVGSTAQDTRQAVPGFCRSRGPIPAAALAEGVTTSHCPLTGRLVVAGPTGVKVPPPGFGVGSAGAAPVGDDTTDVADVHLQVSNLHGVVTARTTAPNISSASGTASYERSARYADVAACRDGRFVLESGGHPWAQPLHWRYHQRSTPARMSAAAAIQELKRGNHNIVSGRNDCGLRGSPRAAGRYDGTTLTKPNQRVRNGVVSCGSFNTKNSVGWGALPGNLLGYTCYWWNGRGKMIAADMRLDPDRRTVISYPRNCDFKFDLQSLATHEWGHAYGLGHPGSRHVNLTMAHLLPACSTAPRTLGLGDWRGMRNLYGLR